MDRRDFLKKSAQAGMLAGLTSAFGGFSKISASPLLNKPSGFDLAAIKGGEPDVMFDKGIASLGGMKAFVKKGQTVLVKPNIGWDVSPERGGNTNPLLIKTIIKRCYEAGAKQVYVFDHTCDNWKNCYSNSGIERAAKDAGAQVVSGDSEGYYQNVTIKGASRLKTAKVHELVLSSDVFINVPVLKNHGSTGLTIGMKNMMGVVWDRGFWHSSDLQRCIAEYGLFRKPDLNIVDAYYVMKRNGPRGVSKEDVVTMKSQLISRDIVAIDTAAAKLFGSNPADMDYIKIANDLKIGNMNLDKLSINRIIM